MKNTVNTIPYYTFGSPRYKSIVNYPTAIIPEDYGYHDSVLGTYDINFPLYAIDESPIPKLELVDKDNNTSEIQGSLQYFLAHPNFKSKDIGKTSNRISPKNSNLDYKVINYNQYMNIKLNPAWCVMQQGRFLVRILGNSILTKQLYTLDLNSTALGRIYANFPKGIIVDYKGVIWKCKTSTNLYPPEPNEVSEFNDFWENMEAKLNIFNADLFVINANSIEYFMEAEDTNRQFNPLIQDDNLVCWNLAYWQE